MSIVGLVWMAAGVALARVALGKGAAHWAVRALCVLAIVAGLAAAVVGMFLAAAWSAGADGLGGLVVGAVLGGLWAALGVGGAALERFGLSKGRAALASVVLLAVVVVVAAAMGGRDAPAQAAQVVAPVALAESRPAQAAAVEASGTACDCAAGAVCVGPRGGKYCLTAEGKKRYING